MEITAPWAQAVFTLIIGIGVWWVSYQQHRNAREKLSLDLFEKRYEIYGTLIDYYFPSPERIENRPSKGELLKATRAAAFLFDQSIADTLVSAYFKDGHAKGLENQDRVISAVKEMELFMAFDRPHKRRPWSDMVRFDQLRAKWKIGRGDG